MPAMTVLFPRPYPHNHPPIINTNELLVKEATPGQRAADWVASRLGSWRFIVIQSILLSFWVALNVLAWIEAWDPYPFILLNLFLSLQAAYAAPVIMMSQNRQSEIDRVRAENDYAVNRKAEEEIRVVLQHLEAQNRALEILLADRDRRHRGSP
jgi:uncharacterized membrane protein